VQRAGISVCVVGREGMRLPEGVACMSRVVGASRMEGMLGLAEGAASSDLEGRANGEKTGMDCRLAVQDGLEACTLFIWFSPGLLGKAATSFHFICLFCPTQP